MPTSATRAFFLLAILWALWCLPPVGSQGQPPLFFGRQYLMGIFPSDAAAADLNGNGQTHLAKANMPTESVSILLGNGQGGFGAAMNLAGGNQPVQIKSGDLNGDGQTDLVVVNKGSDNLSVLTMPGRATSTRR